MENFIDNLVNHLIEKRYTISIAESLTGGLVCSMLCEVPGVSSVLMEGIVSYTDKSKISRLGVQPQTLKQFTAVSLEVAKEMAVGVRKNLNSDIGISTTGLAGPLEFDEFGNKKGTVFIAISMKDEIYGYRFDFEGQRDEIRKQAAKNCLEILFDTLLRKEKI